MAKIEYRCIQYGECEKADAREVITLDAGEEPICPNSDCGKPLTKADDRVRGGGDVIKRIAVVAAVIVLIGGGIFFWLRPSTDSVKVEDALVDVWPWLKSG
jgi:hypothetical protein